MRLRFRTAAGDTYGVSAPRTSIRFERLVRASRILKDTTASKRIYCQRKYAVVAKLNNALQRVIDRLKTVPAQEMVEQAKKILNK